MSNKSAHIKTIYLPKLWSTTSSQSFHFTQKTKNNCSNANNKKSEVWNFNTKTKSILEPSPKTSTFKIWRDNSEISNSLLTTINKSLTICVTSILNWKQPMFSLIKRLNRFDRLILYQIYIGIYDISFILNYKRFI